MGGNFIPQANFIGTTTGTTRQVQFTDNSIGTPTSWYWNFGDGNTSTSQNPTNIYPYSSSTQYYTVSEKVTNAAGNTTITESNYVKISSNSITVQTKSSNPPTYTIAPDEQFTEQNMTNFAAANNIRLYMIAYANANNMNSQAISDMNVMANGTGGFYAAAPNAATLAQIYTNIAGQLQTAAGVNTQMNLNFQSVNVTGVTVPGADALSYVAANPGSTDITWQDGVTNNTDQSGQWPNLIFNIGTINLGQTWQATFQLRVLEGGSIQLFGNQSTITFNNGTSSMQLPPAYITSLANLTNTGVTTQSILLSPLLLTQSGIITDFVPLQWSTTYPGAQTAMERLYYSTSYQEPQTCGASPWVGPFDTQTGILPGGLSETSSLDVRTLPPGTYYICVLAQAPDALSATAETGSGAQVKMSGKSYIRLE